MEMDAIKMTTDKSHAYFLDNVAYQKGRRKVMLVM